MCGHERETSRGLRHRPHPRGLEEENTVKARTKREKPKRLKAAAEREKIHGGVRQDQQEFQTRFGNW